MLSPEFKNAFKTAISLVIAYGIALANDWGHPSWAAFSVIIFDQATSGQSMNKGFARVLGTIVAAVVSLGIIALFSQNRWLFMLSLSLYVAFTTYMTTGKKYKYFYHVAGFVAIIICLSGGATSTHSFDLAIMRVQETAMGVVVYTVVNTIFWPENSYGKLKTATLRLSESLITKNAKLFETLQNPQLNESHINCSKLHKLHDNFSELLESAKVDSTDVWQRRSIWEGFENSTTQLIHTYDAFANDIGILKDLNIASVFLNFSEIKSQLHARLTQILSIIQQGSLEFIPESIDIRIDTAEIKSLSHSKRADALLIYKHIERIDKQVMELHSCVHDLEEPKDDEPLDSLSALIPTLDKDRFIAALRYFVFTWFIYILWILIRVPGSNSFVLMGSLLGRIVFITPYVPVKMLVKPSLFVCVTSGLIYLFLMPHLSGYEGLGILIFAYTFSVTYTLSRPEQVLLKTFALSMFCTVTAITNQQSYSLISVATTLLTLGLVLFMLKLFINFPCSARSEKMVLVLLNRYFKYAEHLILSIGETESHKLSRFKKWRMVHTSNALVKIPHTLNNWIYYIDTSVYPPETKDHLLIICNNLQTLAYHIQRLTYFASRQEAVSTLDEWKDEITTWKRIMTRSFSEIESTEKYDTKEELTKFIDKININTKVVIDNNEIQDSTSSHENYFLLAGFQTVSRSVIINSAEFGKVDWEKLKETKF